MDESYAALGILLIAAVAMTAYFSATGGAAGAAVGQDYLGCCCNILTDNGAQALVRSQVQMHADNCPAACERYSEFGTVFSQEGLCAENP